MASPVRITKIAVTYVNIPLMLNTICSDHWENCMSEWQLF